MISIEFCIQKSILIFWGVWLWRVGSLKSKLLASRTPNAYKEGHSIWPIGQFFKRKSMYVCSSASGLQSQRKKLHLISISTVLQPKKQKSATFARFGNVFNQMCGASRISKWDAVLPAKPPVQEQNWACKWVFLKILLMGWDMGTFLRTFWHKIRKSGPF